MASTNCCYACGSDKIDHDVSRGDAVCTSCGLVLEDNIIVSEVQFEDNRLGGTSAVGQFVSSEGKAPIGGGYRHGIGRESRAITLYRARQKISQLVQQLRLNPRCVDAACKFFRMAMEKKLTRGRKNTHIIAACVYMVCRMNHTAHMLLDLSDIVQVNVYHLGKTFLYLTQALHIKTPIIDPSWYMLRFAHKLDFGDKMQDVYKTAMKLVEAMKTDWMHVGRRPSGLCGAALLVAARFHDFNRTTTDIIRVVKVCEATLKKRLNEFGDTPSSQLTIEEFMSIKLEEAQDPPAFKLARKRAKYQQRDSQFQNDDVTKQITVLQAEIEKALDEHRRKIRGPYAKLSAISEDSTEENSNLEEPCVEDFVAEETVEAIQEFVARECGMFVDGETSEAAITVVGDSENLTPVTKVVKSLGPTSLSLGLKESIEECMKVNPTTEIVEESGELDLSGIDDKEIDYYIMNDREVESKTTLWNKVNAEYLEEQKVKAEKAAKDIEEGIVKPEKKKRKGIKRKNMTPANTAGEALEKMLQERRISSKINYEVLKNLNNNDDDEGIDSSPKTSTAQPEVLFSPSFATNCIPEGTLASRLAPAILGPPSSKRNLFPKIPEPKSKRLHSMLSKNKGIQLSSTTQDDPAIIEEAKASIPPSEREIVVETAPIQYEEDNLTDEECDEDEDDYGDHISAAKLFGRTDAEIDYEEYDDYYCDDDS